MYQLILSLFALIFAALNLYVNDTDKNSYSSESTEEAYEALPKAKNSSSSKKKKPKRNRSAFIIFSSEMRAKLRNDKFEKLNSNEMMVRLAELWKNLAENEKKKYHDQAEQEKVRYNAELNSFYQKNPFEVIQNKTKKNHIKKPCSAYAIYLKETKVSIKAEHPELKMADILKIVAERWKSLTDDKKVYFQKKALEEKEATKAKLNQQNQEEEALKKDSKKTASPTNKKSSKSFSQDIKIEDEIKTEQVEPTLFKRQLFNANLPNNYFMSSTQFYPEFNTEYASYNPLGYFNNEVPAFNFNSTFNNNSISNLLSYLPQSITQQPRKSFDGQVDYFGNFNAKADSFYVKDENIESFDDEDADPSTNGEITMTPDSHFMPGSAGSHVLTDGMTSSLDDDFKLDCGEFDRIENFGSEFRNDFAAF